jgi:[protein-PII] uridylyltransferase
VSFRAARQALLARTELHGDDFCRALSAAADEWLQGLLGSASGGDEHGVALLAVGGYGRGELCPFSDLDVVLVHRRRRDIGPLADAVWYPVWDEGIRLDHSVRRPKDVLAVASEDLRAQLGLLDGRVVAGDGGVVVPILAEASALWRRQAPAMLPLLAEQVRTRRAEQGDVAFLLEPDIKEAHGGLRDVSAVRAVARGVPALSDHVDLSALEPPRQVLTAVRVELHRLTGRATDRLLLQEQDAVGAALGYADADALMAAVAEAGRTIAWVVDDAWQRRALWRSPRRGARRRQAADGAPAGAPVEAEPVEDGIALAGDGTGPTEVVLSADAPVADDVTLALRVAAVAAERGLPVGRSALEHLAERAPAPPEPWPEPMRRSFVRLLAAGPRAIPAIEALDQRRLLERVLPEWEAVRNRPQRNAYHRFTVDRHLLETAANAATGAARVARPDLLLVGALLHDIGKGFPGDHTDAGVEVVGRMARRMGFPPDDARTLVAMVRNHLLLPDVATRRDLDDPVTIDTVADAVEDATTLDLLAALAEADGTATGQAAWGPWKAGLVADLVRRVHDRLAGAAPVPASPSPITDRHRVLMRQAERLGRTVVAAEPPTVTVVARDRAGLLAAVTGVLALRGLDVRSADVAGEDGFAVEIFVVEPSRGRWPDWQRVGDEVDAALRGTLPLDERLAEQDRLYERRRPAKAEPTATSVTVDNDASAASTVIEVRASDRAGLLHDVTRALFGLDLDVTTARVSTLGDEVVDAFYVRDRTEGGKLTDAARLGAVEAAVRQALEREPAL